MGDNRKHDRATRRWRNRPGLAAARVRQAFETRSEYVPAALLAIAGAIVFWAATTAPHVWGFAAVLATAILLDILAGDVMRVGRRVVAPGLVLCVAAFIVYGTGAAAIVGCARGIVRALWPRPLPITDASCIVATSTLGPLLGGLSSTAVHYVAPQPWVAAAVYVAGAFTIEAGAAMLLLSRVSRPTLRTAFEQTLGWTTAHYAALGALGAWLGTDLRGGDWITLAYFALPIIIIRQGFDVFNSRAEQYVAALEHENTQLFDKIGQLDRITGDLAEAVGMAIDCREGIDYDHSHRVARLASAIGQELGMSSAAVEILRRGALLHDVGTLAVPAELFAKPGPLTPKERRRMQLHSEFGARLVAKWRDSRALAAIVEQHHERLDGSGYPRGLKGDQIVLEARIVGAAEAYVALTSERPHRKAFSHEEALQILNERTPAEYDAAVVEALATCAAKRSARVLPLPMRTNG